VARQRPLHHQRDNDLRLGRLDSNSDGLGANTTAERPSFTSPRGGREPAIKAKEPEVSSAGGTDDLVGGGNRFSKGKPHLWQPPPQHRRQRPPAHQHHAGERRSPQSAPTGPHSRPRHKNENGIVLEHEYRPRGVRRVVRPPGVADGARGTWTWPARARHDHRPGGGRTAASWLGSSSSPFPAWLVVEAEGMRCAVFFSVAILLGCGNQSRRRAQMAG
jgi:hypothetical protein